MFSIDETMENNLLGEGGSEPGEEVGTQGLAQARRFRHSLVAAATTGQMSETGLSLLGSGTL